MQVEHRPIVYAVEFGTRKAVRDKVRTSLPQCGRMPQSRFAKTMFLLCCPKVLDHLIEWSSSVKKGKKR